MRRSLNFRVRAATEAFLNQKEWGAVTKVYIKGKDVQVEWNSRIYVFATVSVNEDMRATIDVEATSSAFLTSEDRTILKGHLKNAENDHNATLM